LDTRKFHEYPYRQEFHLRTDHSTRTWLISFKNHEGQAAYAFSACKNTALLWSIVKARSITMLKLFPENHVEKSVLTVKTLRHEQKSSRCELLQP
jgi:hypothetical protein